MKFVGAGLLNLLSQTAENGYGRGEMVHILLKDDKQMHKQVSVISAMIIRDKKVLHTLLVKHGGLYTMVELILTKDEQLTNEAATGLTGKIESNRIEWNFSIGKEKKLIVFYFTALARTLEIAEPKFDMSRISKLETIVGGDCYTDADNWMDNENLVTFVSGDPNDVPNESNMIRFSERILTQNSDVFNRMFNSDFQESKNKQVFLKKQSIEGIRYFLNCIKQQSMENTLRTPIIKNTPTTTAATTTIETTQQDTVTTLTTLKAALEAYDMCQIYLLPELEADILNMIVYLLSADNILDLFIFSMQSHKQELTEMSINYFLTSNLAPADKVKVFRAADDCEFFKEWNDLILDTIAYTCQNHSF